MKIITYISFFLALMGTSLMAQEAQITTRYGKIQGNIEGDIMVFKGIPFADPPVGSNRWKAPQELQPWEGVKTCTEFGPSPVQGAPRPFMFWSSEFLIPEAPISEDCLYLNIWAKKDTASKKPVLVYIYGGGFRSGGSGCPIYDGMATARKDVVYVSLNYRVGVFGFMAHPELSAESEQGASGNYALMDMIAALKWVKENIEAFGGDPENVTIAGQSAGAFAISYLTASPLATGTFQKAIAQSGAGFYSSAGRSIPSLKEAEKMGTDFATQLGAEDLKALREIPAETLLNAQGGLSWPILDGYVLPQSLKDAYDSDNENKVDLLLGWNEDDFLAAGGENAAKYKEKLVQEYGEKSAEVLEFYPANTDEEAQRSQLEMGRDQTFAFQVYGWAKAQAAKKENPVYLYNFNRDLPAYDSSTAFGAFHSGEIVYAYDNLHTLDRPWTEADRQLASQMSEYWVQFAKHGNPNTTTLPHWAAFRPDDQQVMVLDTELKLVSLPNRGALEFWEAQN